MGQKNKKDHAHMPATTFESIALDIERDDLRMLRRLVDGAFKPDLMRDAATGNSLLSVAAISGSESAAKLLLRAGAKAIHQNAQGQTPLWLAARHGNVAVMATLLEAVPGLDVTDDLGVTPIISALRSRQVEAAAFLIQRGCTVNRADQAGFTPIYLAALLDDTSIARVLISAGSRVGPLQGAKTYRSALVAAAYYGSAEMCECLLDHGASLDETDFRGITPLMAAARNGGDDVLRLLLRKGARLDLKTDKEQSLAQYLDDPEKIARMRRITAEVLHGVVRVDPQRSSPAASRPVMDADAGQKQSRASARSPQTHTEPTRRKKPDARREPEEIDHPSQTRRGRVDMTPRRTRLMNELAHAWKHLSRDDRARILDSIGKQFGAALLRRAVNLVGVMLRLVKIVAGQVGGAVGDTLSHDPRGLLAQRFKAILSDIGGAVLGIGKSLGQTMNALLTDPAKRLPELLVGALGFYAGSGGLDGDGGIPDTDIDLLGIGAHRSPLTHSVIAGAVAEAIVVGFLRSIDQLHRQLPPNHDPVWDRLHEGGSELALKFQAGTSAGIAWHLGIDSTLQPAPYHDLPVEMPIEVHQAIFGVNAAAEAVGGAIPKSSARSSAEAPRPSPSKASLGVMDAVNAAHTGAKVTGWFLLGFWQGLTETGEDAKKRKMPTQEPRTVGSGRTT